MAQLFRYKRVHGVSDDAVKAKTGKKWDEWFYLLDKAGARMMDHRDIAGYLRRNFGLTEWWTRLVSAGYQSDRAVRASGRRATAYSVDRTRTMAAPLATVWAAWQDRALRERWLPGVEFTVRSVSPNKSISLEWPGGTHANISFLEKTGKTRVRVIHTLLAEEVEADQLLAYWTAALDRLREILGRRS